MFETEFSRGVVTGALGMFLSLMFFGIFIQERRRNEDAARNSEHD